MKADVTIQSRKGRPVIRRGSETASQNVYCDDILNDGWRERIGEFIESGVQTFHLRVPQGGRVRWKRTRYSC